MFQAWGLGFDRLRFRVACALKAFLHLHLAGKAGAAGSDKGRVLVHDWAESRMQKYKDINDINVAVGVCWGGTTRTASMLECP